MIPSKDFRCSRSSRKAEECSLSSHGHLRLGKDPGIRDPAAQGWPERIQALGMGFGGRGQQTQQGPTLELSG